MRTRGFVTNELLQVIAVAAVWIGISLPIYGAVIKSMSGSEARVSVGTHLLVLIAAGLVPPALVFGLRGLECLLEFVWNQIKRRDRPE